MALIVAGVNHQTAPIEIREKLALAPSEIGPTLEKLKSESGAREAVVITTCNRTEFWAVEGELAASSFIGQLMSERLG
jgi:glutamyl-tRNA reductase